MTRIERDHDSHLTENTLGLNYEYKTNPRSSDISSVVVYWKIGCTSETSTSLEETSNGESRA